MTNETACETALMKKLAEADGEVEGPDEAVDLHFEECSNCRVEFDQILATDIILLRQRRSESEIDLWPEIANEINKAPSRRIGWLPFVVLGGLLISTKLLEMLPERDLGLVFKLTPVAVAVLLFFVIRVNPFRINSDLLLEKQS